MSGLGLKGSGSSGLRVLHLGGAFRVGAACLMPHVCART